MGGLAVVSPQTGPRGSPEAHQERNIPPFWVWFPSFLSDELRPYPGRYLLASRYVLAATLTMLMIITFRIPGASVGGFYSLLLPRSSFRMTAQSAVGLLGAFAMAMAFVMLGTMLFIDYPLAHFLWVIVSFFVGFMAIAVVTNYAAASAATILIVLTVPTWDARLPVAAIVFSNLWVIGSVGVAIGATLLVEFAFAFFVSKSQLDSALYDRLSTVRTYLNENADGRTPSKTKDTLQRFAMLGTAALHSLAVSGNAGKEETARRSAQVFLVGRMVDLVASLDETEAFTSAQKPRLLALAAQVQGVQAMLRGRARQAQKTAPRALKGKWPILLEAERTADLLALIVSGGKVPAQLTDLGAPPDPPFFVPDAWSNPKHLRFALRGCLALVLCYTVMNAIAWPNLGTSLFTVVITTLSSTGSSRQKQLMRLSGAIIGGLVLGIGSQVLILPGLNGIAGFTVLFVTVTFIAAWFLTASPRLSYFGTQMALAFYIVQLSAPIAQIHLVVARDNFIGDLLGLLVMAIVYNGVRSRPAVALMTELLVNNLKLMAKLATPLPKDRTSNAGEIGAWRDKISQNFSAVNAQADGVFFESATSRRSTLQLRNRLLGLLPSFRRLYLVQIAMLQYGVSVASAELPDVVLKAQTHFNASVHSLLEDLAKNFINNKDPQASTPMKQALKSLCEAVDTAYGQQVTPQAQAMLSLSSRVSRGAIALLSDLHGHGT